MNQASNSDRGTKIESGDKFGIAGYWVITDRTHPVPVSGVEADDIASGSTKNHGTRLTYIYWGTEEPTQDEVDLFLSSE